MKLLNALLLVLLVVLLPGCPDQAMQIQVQTANAIAQAANAELPILVEQFRQEGLSELKEAEKRGATNEEAKAIIAAVEKRWSDIWKAWDGLRLAHDTWATVLEHGGSVSGALLALQTAYCGLMGVWPKGIPFLPLSPVTCPQKSTTKDPTKP